MYAVSADYINQIKAGIQQRRLTGTLGNATFTSEDVLAGSFSIKSSAMNKSDLKYGSVGITTCSITLFNSFALTIPRASYKGLVLTPSVALKVGNTWESVPCGVFTVDEAIWTEIGVQLTAYDNMSKFDKPITLDVTSGEPYDLLALACQVCGVTLGNTRAQIEAMTNGTESFYINPENDIETWRDFIYWTAQVLAGFATCDRSGQLVVRQFGNDTGITLGTAHRFTGIKLSDFVTSYTGVSVTLIEDDSTLYRGASVDTGLTMNLGSNPLLQDVETRETRMGNIVDELVNLQYTPFSCKLIGDMAFDLGDVLHFDGGVAASDDCCIMAYNYIFGKEYTAEGYGENPALATARTKVDKELSGIKSRTRSNVVEMRMFVNAQDIVLLDDELQTVITLDFTTIDDTNVSILHEIQLDCDSEDMDVEVTYHLNENEITYHPVENWKTDGKHILSLMYFVGVEGGNVYTWTVSLKVSGGNAMIYRDNARACLSGQGLAAVAKWNGRIDIDEDINVISLPLDSVAIMSLNESLETPDIDTPTTITLADSVLIISLDTTSPTLMGMSERVTFKDALKDRTWGDVKLDTWGTVKNDYTWG